MERLKEVVDGIGELITDTVMTEQEGSRRCLNSDDLNILTKWMDLIDEVREGNQVNSENANCAIFDVSKALIAFFKWREGQQLTADTVNEIETFAKEYQSNL